MSQLNLLPKNPGKWPKKLPPLTPEQEKISDEFMKQWLGHLSRKFKAIESFNHGFPVRHSPAGFEKTLEIGAGLGEHLRYEKLTPAQEQGYHCIDSRPEIADVIREKHPSVSVITGDCQKPLSFPDGFFDRVIAIHVLEHLPDLPSCIREMHRLLHKDKGVFLVVIPTEGSPAYSLARKISAERLYKRLYGGDYSWFYRREHINLPHEILEELHPYFEITTRRYFPLFFIPMIFCNLCIGLELKPRPVPLAS